MRNSSMFYFNISINYCTAPSRPRTRIARAASTARTSCSLNLQKDGLEAIFEQPYCFPRYPVVEPLLRGDYFGGTELAATDWDSRCRRAISTGRFLLSTARRTLRRRFVRQLRGDRRGRSRRHGRLRIRRARCRELRSAWPDRLRFAAKTS